ncbi:hypothetical protein AB0G41_27360 [Streptomyces rimosus]|nr:MULTISPECIES: hypothetical protein [Streptomyces]UNZ03886.1 hypothetical protein SRIMR7_17140 [Streptomyces rimosus subsp. rimosus]UTH95393.1 hypothetical protein SRIMHP_14775 [Streptomyces rimosus subsp. rimosus]UTJ13490.1 hypothetical protein SRIMDV3_14670 [Streptomyces rimosus subsp. rimosus]
MPMPYGSRGGMAFSADELRVLRRALAAALGPTRHTTGAPDAPAGYDADGAQEVQEYLRLAEAVDEAAREGGRLRAFLLADLVRYREALPGSASGYLAHLQEALAVGYDPAPADLAALRSLVAGARGAAESERRTALLRRCESLAEQFVRARLRALPGGRGAKESEPAPRPAPVRPQPKAPRPGRPVPTPGEVFPPRRKPAPPPAARTA